MTKIGDVFGTITKRLQTKTEDTGTIVEADEAISDSPGSMKSARTRTHLRPAAGNQGPYSQWRVADAWVTIWDNSASKRNLLKVPWLRSPAIVERGRGGESRWLRCAAKAGAAKR